MHKISRWDKLRSYIQDVHLESISSEVNGDIDLWLVKGQLQLCASTAIYSYGERYMNFIKSFEMLNLDALPDKNVLSLGFGLGSIPMMLENKFKKIFHYTGVELDEEILLWANDYILGELKSDCELILADAYQFMSINSAKFAMIAMDVFMDAEVPEEFEDMEYLEMLKAALLPGGILLYNRMSHSEGQKEHTAEFFEQVFKSVFPEGVAVQLGGNTMLFSTDRLFIKKK
jgi:spermidine synthase